MINVLYEDNHLLVVEKPINVPVQEDSSRDLDLLSMLKNYIKEKYSKPSNVYLGLVHRLDRPVGGVMVFAKTSKAASRLSEQVRSHDFKKEYLALVEGRLDGNGTYKDYLLKDEKNNIVRIDSRGKEAILNFSNICFRDNLSLVKIELITGRSHQIRVQFSSHNHPLYGDQKYNESSKIGQQIALFAYKLSFYHPVTKQLMTFKLSIPKRRPWNLFDDINNI